MEESFDQDEKYLTFDLNEFYSLNINSSILNEKFR